MKVPGKQLYRFEGVELDPSQGCLRRGGEELPVRQKSLHVLCHLIEERHRLVTKEELIGRFWSGVAVTDDSLVQLVTELRRALGDDPRRPRFIKTVPRAGYRFIAPVEEHFCDPTPTLEVERHASFEIEFEEEVSEEAVAGDRVATALATSPSPSARASLRRRTLLAAALVLLLAAPPVAYLLSRPRRPHAQAVEVTLPQLAGKRTLAVMYFDNLSASPELDWLREGLADMLITDLSRSPGFTVLSRRQLQLLLERAGHEPAAQLRLEEALDIGRRSRAEVVVLGSFARLDEKVRVEVQLHDAQTGLLLAAESLTTDRPGELLEQVGLLSFKLATHLGAAPRAPRQGLADVLTHNLEAYRYYSLAVEKAQALHNAEAIALLEKAVALDPQFALAHARIGYAYGITWNYPEKAKPHFERAFQLSERLTEKDGLYITAWYAIVNRDFGHAIETFRALVAEHPLEVEAYVRLGMLLHGEERDEEAVSVLRQGLAVDPEEPHLYNVLGGVYSTLGRHDEAVRMHRRYVELSPGEPNAHDSLGMSLNWAGRYEGAVEEYRRALALKPEFEVAVIHLGNTYFAMGRYAEAAAQFERYARLAKFDGERFRGYGSLAQLYLKRGELRRAEHAARLTSARPDVRFWLELPFALKRAPSAVIEELASRFPEAEPQLNRGTADTPRNFYYWRGSLNLRRGRAQDAVEDFREALRHTPPTWQMEAYEDCLANAYLELGRPDEAVEEYERVLRLNPNYPLAHYGLGRAYERKGLAEQARASYEHFLEVWEGADDDLPEVVAARRFLSGLQARSQ